MQFRVESICNAADKAIETTSESLGSCMRRMRTYILIACVIAAAGGFGGNSVYAGQQPAKANPISLIEADYNRGEVTIDEKALLQLEAIQHPDHLPDKYRQSSAELRLTAGRTSTPTILRIIRDWDQYKPETQAALAEALQRPSGTYTFDSPSGFFKIHYEIAGSAAVPTADGNGNGIPDYVEKIASYCDSSLAKHRALGYLDPPADGGLGGDDKYDVYLRNISDYGYTTPEAPGPESWLDYTSFLVMDNTYTGFPPNDDPEGQVAGAAKATAAHEFHHAVQFAYDVSEHLWYMELDATCMEDIVFDQVNDNYNYLPWFMGDPEETLMLNDGTHKYASFIYGLYLAQRFDTSLNVALWEGARFDDLFETLVDTLEARYGMDRESSFVEFTYWNYITGFRDDGLHHEEAAEYPPMVLAREYQSYPVYETPAQQFPAGYGASYIQFRPGSLSGSLTIAFNGDDTHSWAAYIIKSASQNSHEFEAIPLNSGTYDGEVSVGHFEDYYDVTLVAVNLTPYSDGGQFVYSADVAVPYSVTSTVLTDSVVCVGETRIFDYQVVNTSETGEVFTITSEDNMGWIVPDTMDVYIAAGDSDIVHIPVHPPAGTPLGVTSTLEFKAEVKAAPYTYDLQPVQAVTIPHRGDANVDGTMNLQDITLIIGSVYLAGPPLDPMWAADFTCDGTVNLQDITGIIGRVYLGGAHSPCDPY